MNMIFMVGIMVLIFFASMTVMCFYRNKMPPAIWNIAFIIADVVFFFCWNYAGYERGWLDEGWMTFENISPLICTVVPLTLFMSDTVRKHAHAAIAFLSVGMFVAMMISPEHAYLFSFNTEANFLYTSEAACHLVCSLFGIYLVLSGQVKADFVNWRRSLVFMYSLIGFGVVLNYVFHKTYFGMNPYGNSSIYMIDIFGSHDATLIAYLFGVLIVLTVGMQCMKLLDAATSRLFPDTESAGEPPAVTDECREEEKSGEKDAVGSFEDVAPSDVCAEVGADPEMSAINPDECEAMATAVGETEK